MDNESKLIQSHLEVSEFDVPNSIQFVDDFVCLSSESNEESSQDNSDYNFELIESFSLPKEPDSDWIKISNKFRVYSNQRIKKMLEAGVIPYNRRNWKRTVVSGIPNEMRGDIWIYFSQQKNALIREKYPKWVSSLRKPEIDQEIDKDIKRTFSTIPEFNEKNQGRMFNILKAYSRFDPEVGYCQGMSYIAGLLTLYIWDECTAFCVFEDIMSRFGWREIYIKGMPKLLSLVAKLKGIIKEKLPKLSEHLDKNGVYFEGLFSPLFLTVFISNAPLELAVRIFDLFMIDGENSLMDCVLNIVELMQTNIMQLTHEAIHLYIKSDIIKECYEKFNFATIVNLHNSI